MSARYFATLFIPVVKGRAFMEFDFGATAMPVVVINEAFARSFFPNQNALGKRLKMGETIFVFKIGLKFGAKTSFIVLAIMFHLFF